MRLQPRNKGGISEENKSGVSKVGHERNDKNCQRPSRISSSLKAAPGDFALLGAEFLKPTVI